MAKILQRHEDELLEMKFEGMMLKPTETKVDENSLEAIKTIPHTGFADHLSYYVAAQNLAKGQADYVLTPKPEPAEEQGSFGMKIFTWTGELTLYKLK